MQRQAKVEEGAAAEETSASRRLARSKWLKLRVNDLELATVQDKARASGLTLSAYQRRACLDGVVVVRDTTLEHAILVQLSRIGRDLNQIAKAANTSALVGRHFSRKDHEKLLDLVEEIGASIHAFVS